MNFMLVGWNSRFLMDCKSSEEARRRAEAFARERHTITTLYEVRETATERVCTIPKPEGDHPTATAPPKVMAAPVVVPVVVPVVEPTITDLIEEISLLE